MATGSRKREGLAMKTTLRRPFLFLWCLIPLGIFTGEWKNSAFIVGLFTLWVMVGELVFNWGTRIFQWPKKRRHP